MIIISNEHLGRWPCSFNELLTLIKETIFFMMYV